MIRTFIAAAALSAASLFVVGCGSNTYTPNASDTQLSAYAGQAAYPKQLHPDEAPHIFSSITADNTITIWNAGDMPLNNFDLWVNQTFVLHVNKQDGRTKGSYAPNTLFNRTGTSLAASGSTPISSIQIRMTDGGNDKLVDVQGPVADR